MKKKCMWQIINLEMKLIFQKLIHIAKRRKKSYRKSIIALNLCTHVIYCNPILRKFQNFLKYKTN